MEHGSNAELVRKHYANVSGGNIERDREIMSKDVAHKSPAAGTIGGIAAYRGFIAGFKQAFPDMRLDIGALIEGPDTVVAEGVFTGTNTGSMMGMPATGKRVELAFCDIWKVRDGRIVENRIYYDQMTFLGQLGLMQTGT